MDDQQRQEIWTGLLQLSQYNTKKRSDPPEPIILTPEIFPELFDLVPACLLPSHPSIGDKVDAARLFLTAVAFNSENPNVRAAGDLLGFTNMSLDEMQAEFKRYGESNPSDQPAKFKRFGRETRKVMAGRHLGIGVTSIDNKNREPELFRQFVEELCTYLDNESGKLANLAHAVSVVDQDAIIESDAEATSIASKLNEDAELVTSSSRQTLRTLPSKLRNGLRRLADIISAQLEGDQNANRVGLPPPIPAHWQASGDDDGVDNWENICEVFGAVSGRLETPDDVEGLANLVSSSPAGRLVILGRGGAGKTTLATELAWKLLQPNRHGDGDPVPVIFNLSSWDLKKQPKLADWMVAELERMYPFLSRSLVQRLKKRESRAAELIKGAHVIPVLDGLDEMDGLDKMAEPLRTQAIKAINQWLTRSRKLVLLSRPQEYREATTHGPALSGALVLILKNAKPEDVQTYLTRATGRKREWAAVFKRLKEEQDEHSRSVQGVLTTPLMAMLAGVIYNRKGKNDKNSAPEPIKLLDDVDRFANGDNIATYLLNSFIDVRFDNLPREMQGGVIRNWGNRNAKRWLGFLALALAVDKRTSFSWWRTEGWLRYVTLRWKLPLALTFLVAMVRSIWIAISQWSVSEALLDWSGLIFVAGMAYAMIFIAALNSPPRVFTGQLKFQSPFTDDRLDSFGVTGLAVFLGIGSAGMLSRGLGALGFFAFLPILTLPLIWSSPASTDVNSPKSLLQRDQRSLMVRFAVFGASMTLALFVRSLILSESLVLHIPAVMVCIAFALLAPFSASVNWNIRRTALALSGRLPWQCMTFLEDAQKLGILRQSGGAFQFRHILLQSQLAHNYIESSSDSIGNIQAEEIRVKLAFFHSKAGRPERAIEELRGILEMYNESLPVSDWHVARTVHLLIESLRAANRAPEALSEIISLRASGRKLDDEQDWISHRLHVEILLDTGDRATAQVEYERLCETLKRSIGEIDAVTSDAARKFYWRVTEDPVFTPLRSNDDSNDTES